MAVSQPAHPNVDLLRQRLLLIVGGICYIPLPKARQIIDGIFQLPGYLLGCVLFIGVPLFLVYSAIASGKGGGDDDIFRDGRGM